LVGDDHAGNAAEGKKTAVGGGGKGNLAKDTGNYSGLARGALAFAWGNRGWARRAAGFPVPIADAMQQAECTEAEPIGSLGRGR